MTLYEELKSHFEAMREAIRLRGPSLHEARFRQALERVELAAEIYDRREKYLDETLQAAKNTVLIYRDGDTNCPMRRQVIRVTPQHVVVAWHEPRMPEHRFHPLTGCSLQPPRPGQKPHRIDAGELEDLRQTWSALQE